MPDPSRLSECPMCARSISLAANFCSRCGYNFNEATRASSSQNSRWYHNIWFVLFMLFFVLGPFGLPMVWGNPKLSRPVKIILTGVMLLYIWMIVELMMKAASAITNNFNQYNALFQY